MRRWRSGCSPAAAATRWWVSANAALLRFVAQCLGVPPGSVQLLRGHTSRRKLISVAGWSAQAVHQALLANI